jgi:hypothetical protein
MAVRSLSQQQFIEKARSVHGNKYDYSQAIYIKSNDPVNIICKIHGGFNQRPSKHLLGQGCPTCGKLLVADSHLYSHDEFVHQARLVHGDSYQYNNQYIGNKTKIAITCALHGDFLQKPNVHVSNQAGCPDCGGRRKLTTDQFITKSNTMHDNKFSYPSPYIRAKTKISIICPTHGEFKQLPSDHMRGHGCSQCTNERMQLVSKGGYTEEYFNRHPTIKNSAAVIYLISLSKKSHTFIKVGISINFEKRLKQFSGFQKNPIFVKHTTLYSAFLLEQLILSNLKQHKYYSSERFYGWTECFHNTPEVISEIHNYMNMENNHDNI